MKLNKTLASVTIFFLFTPILPYIIYDAFYNEPLAEGLTFDSSKRGYNIGKSQDVTYFSFYTFFKSGIDPDCIDLITDDDYVTTNF